MPTTATEALMPIPRGLLASINAAPHDDTARLVCADWCQDHGYSRQGTGYGYGPAGATWWEDQLRQGPPPLGLSFFGPGYGDGYGSGYGSGSGVIHTLNGGRVVPETGKNQLVVLPHGWVICGYVAEQTGPYQFRVERATVICRTGGVPWDELADGKRQDSATYRNWGDVTIGPQFVLSREWKGKLPEGQ